ncbi:hypothetical protein KY312_02065 [Candidatus Woesearchaeota archaeon]|nr:hypothetical protein [Candidatus Woesearchaeota archaeon]
MEDEKPISELEKDVKKLDLILLKLPTVLQCHAGGIGGDDYAVGFYLWVSKGNVVMNRIQKFAYEHENFKESDYEFDEYPMGDIETFQILKRFKPDPENDGLDELLVNTEVIEAPEGFYDDGDENEIL